jgi:hypothetical protein
VAAINGDYDVGCYGTPSLHIFNTTGCDFANAQLTLTGYQGLNAGVTATVSLGTIAAGSTDVLVRGYIFGADGSSTRGNLFAHDYDDRRIQRWLQVLNRLGVAIASR